METHDEETFLYFKDSGVDCRLSYRESSDWGGSWIWSHHQKTIIVDADPIVEAGREIMKGHKKR